MRIDCLRGLAMVCVIINHSRLSSLLSWFSYERLWIVTAAEVFVVLSGVVIGMVYGRRLLRNGWRTVAAGLGRRALFLYSTFVGVTVSVLALAVAGVDVSALASSHTPAWFVTPQTMTWSAWRDVLLIRTGPWAFEIIGMYIWLVAAAIPCLLILHRLGWRPLLAASWALYVWYRIDPHPLTQAGFESAFPLLSWQLIFVHGLTIGFHRSGVAAFVVRLPSLAPRALIAATAGFTLLAFCNPWTDGPTWLQARLISPDLFASLYERYFNLSALGIGRLLNLAVALPVGYMALSRYPALARPFERVLVVLGQRSLGAFVLHVYGLLLLTYLPLPDGVLVNTAAQLMLVYIIAIVLDGMQRLRRRRTPVSPFPEAQPLAA